MGRRSKRRGTRSGRYGNERFTAEGFKQYRKDRKLKRKNPEKYKRLKKIAKFSEDGKISKKEARKLAKLGITPNKLRNRNISEYREARDAYDNSGPEERGSQGRRPTFEPLKIKQSAYDMMSGIRRPEPQEEKREAPTPASTPLTIENPYKDVTDSLMAEIDALKSQAAQKPSMIFSGASSVSGADLRIGPSTSTSRRTGTKSFKRRRNTTRRPNLRINTALNI